MLRQLVYVPILVLFFLAFGLQAADRFTVGYTDFKPFIWSDGEAAKGIYVDILREALENRLGIPTVFQQLPPKRLKYNIEQGLVDGFVGAATKDRLKFAVTGRVPVAVGMIGAFARADDKRIASLVEADTLDELKEYTILSYLEDDWAEERLKGFTLDRGAVNLQAALKKLRLGWGDLVLQIEQVVQYNIHQLGYQKELVQLANIAVDPVLYQLLISKKSSYAEITDRLDTALTTMLNEGVIEEIYSSYQQDLAVPKVGGDKQAKVRFIHYATGILPGVLNELADDFNSDHASYRLKPIHMDMERYKQAMKVLLAGRLPTEILMTWAGYRSQYLVDLGFVKDIEKLWHTWQLDRNFPVTTIQAVSYNGKKYGIPLTHHIIPFFYNTAIFKELRIEIPKTWEEFIVAGELLKKNGITPIALGSKERWPAEFWFDYLLIRTAGHDYRRRLLEGEASLTDSEVREVFALWKDLLDRGFFNDDCNELDYTEAAKLVIEGKAAMILNGTWIIGDFENIHQGKGGVDFDFFAFPQIDPTTPEVILGVMDILLRTITGQSEGTDAALTFFADRDIQKRFSNRSGALAANGTVELSFYPPLLKKAARVIADAPHEVFPFDLATPPSVAEIGLTLFKQFLESPDRYPDLLRQAAEDMEKAFGVQHERWQRLTFQN